MKRIKLWKSKHELSDLEAIVDDEDYEKVIEHLMRYRKDGTPIANTGKWYAWESNIPRVYYAVSGCRLKPSMHRVVMDAPKGMDVDHINGDPLDNRKCNLRICTRSQNSQNKRLRRDSASGFKGVFFVKNPAYERYLKEGPRILKNGEPSSFTPTKLLAKPWLAYIGDPNTPATRKRSIKLGYHATKEEAARAYDKKAKELFGEYAYLNFPAESNKE